MVSFHGAGALGVSTVISTSAEPSAATVFSHFTLAAVSFRFSAPVTVSWPKTLAEEAAGAGCWDKAASDVEDGVALATGAEFAVAGAELVVPGAEFVVPGKDFLAEPQDVSASTATTPTPDNAAVRSRTVDFIDAAVATISPIMWGHVARHVPDRPRANLERTIDPTRRTCSVRPVDEDPTPICEGTNGHGNTWII
jgi:hypothetical protein